MWRKSAVWNAFAKSLIAPDRVTQPSPGAIEGAKFNYDVEMEETTQEVMDVDDAAIIDQKLIQELENIEQPLLNDMINANDR